MPLLNDVNKQDVFTYNTRISTEVVDCPHDAETSKKARTMVTGRGSQF